MESLIVFVPETLKNQFSGDLIGYFREENGVHMSICVLGTAIKNKLNHSLNVIGSYSTTIENGPRFLKNDYSVWISIISFKKALLINYCRIKDKEFNVSNCLIVFYDNSLLKSELLLLPQGKKANQLNHFKTLIDILQAQYNDKIGFGFNILSCIFYIAAAVFRIVNILLFKTYYVTKYSALAVHLRNYCETVLWIRNAYRETRFINLKIGNCLASSVTDIALGLLLFYLITSWKSADQIFDSITFCTENVISYINHVVKWLMGSPAGLKLNQPLSSLFGSLVLYYLEIWWSFLSLVKPILRISFQLFIKIGFLGFTFQVAVCHDIFAIISFHVYCIYVYAARLYEIQAKGLYSLSRLFLGRKRNPEPGRIDSCPYSTEELLIGTICFAVLLFLLPTTLVYYIVFTMMRLGVIIISGLMKRTIYFMQTLPMFVSFLWLFFPAYTATSIKVTPLEGVPLLNQGSLIAETTSSSWLDTVKLCKPNIISVPVPVQFGETMWKVIVGKLF